MDRSSRSGGNVGNALFAFSKEEENPRSWFWGFSSSGISTAGWIYETLIAGLDHPCSFRFTHKFCYRADFHKYPRFVGFETFFLAFYLLFGRGDRLWILTTSPRCIPVPETILATEYLFCTVSITTAPTRLSGSPRDSPVSGSTSFSPGWNTSISTPA